MTNPDPVLTRLLEAFNQSHDDALSEGLFDDEIVIHFFMSGRSGELTVMKGLEETRAWMHRAPRDTFTFSLIESAPCDPRPDLPPGERAVWARYRIDVPKEDFVNEGEWTAHVTGDRIVALRVEPNDLE